MLSGGPVRRAALDSVAQCRALSTTTLTRTYDPRCIRAEGFDPNKRLRQMEDADAAFSPAGIFMRQSKSYVIQNGGLEFNKSNVSEKRPSNILLDVLAQRSTNRKADTLSDYHGGV
ncbi:hypothetical protein Aduo_016657 [Ancylostoma duodenale]